MPDVKKLRQLHPKGQGFLDGVLEADEIDAIEAAHDDSAFLTVDLDIETQYCCPKCGYEWSGNPKPNRPKS